MRSCLLVGRPRPARDFSAMVKGRRSLHSSSRFFRLPSWRPSFLCLRYAPSSLPIVFWRRSQPTSDRCCHGFTSNAFSVGFARLRPFFFSSLFFPLPYAEEFFPCVDREARYEPFFRMTSFFVLPVNLDFCLRRRLVLFCFSTSYRSASLFRE